MASPEAGRRTRGARAVMVAGLAAQVSVATVGGLSWLVLPVSAVAYAAACELSDTATGRRSEALRWSGNALALVGLIVLAPRVLLSGDRVEIKQALGLMLMIAQVGQAMGWRRQRDVRSGLTASFGLLVLSASYAPDVLIGIPLIVGWVAVAVALAMLGGLGRLEAVRAAAVAVALGLVAFLVIPAPPTQGARSRLEALAAGRSSDRLPTDAFSATQLDLRRRGTLGTAGVLRVPKDAPPLWRAISFDYYDGTSWTRQVDETALPGDGPSYAVAAARAPTRTDVVQRVGDARADGTIWSPGRIVALSADLPVAPVVDGQGDVQVAPFTSPYTVTSEQPVTDAAVLRRATGADDVDPRWRALPDGLPARVGALARQVAAGSVSRYDTAVAIAAYLRGHATYRLDSPVPLPGEDAVDRFLFVDRTGFCEQFASAEVVMLRSLGIPARLVTGLAYGVPDGGDVLMRVSDLHAWAELWVPGVGWVSSDPTAGAHLAGSASDLRHRLAADLSSLLRALTRVPGGRTSLAVALVVIAVLASALVSRRSRAVAVRAVPRGTPGPALAAFLRLDAQLGARRRREAESLRELSRRLDPSLSDALTVVERECYGPAAPQPAEVRAAVAVLDRASAPGPPAPRARRGRRAARARTPRRG